MTYDSRVGEIPDPSEVPLGHLQRDWEKLVQYGHGVGNVDNLVVSSDLSDEIPRVRQIRRNRHPHTQRADVLVVPNQILHLSHHIERILMFIEKIRSRGSVRRE